MAQQSSVNASIKANAWVKPAIHLAVAIILAGVIANITPPAGLKVEAIKFIGIFAGVMYLLIVDVIPDYIVGFLGVMAIAGFNATPYRVAVAELVGPTNMLVAAAIILGTAATKSGVITRLSFWIMQFFPATYRGQLLSIFTVGTVIGPLIPAAVSKAALAGPMAAAISKNLGFENKSKGASGIFAAAFVCYCSLPILFLSGSAWGMVLFGLMPKEFSAEFSWIKWFISALPWGVVSLIGNYWVVQLLYKPEPAKGLVEGFAKSNLAALGPMPRQQKMVSAILAACLILWVLEPLHHVSATIIAATCAALCALVGVFDRKDFRALVPWDSVIFIGCVLCFGGIFSAVGIPTWTAKTIGGSLKPLVSNIYLYLAVLSILVAVTRMVVISQVGTVAIYFLTLYPLAQVVGIHPWVTGFTIVSATLTWNSFPSNAGWLTAYYSANNGELVTYKSQLKMSIAYTIVSIIGLWVSVPFWRMAGLVQ